MSSHFTFIIQLKLIFLPSALSLSSTLVESIATPILSLCHSHHLHIEELDSYFFLLTNKRPDSLVLNLADVALETCPQCHARLLILILILIKKYQH